MNDRDIRKLFMAVKAVSLPARIDERFAKYNGELIRRQGGRRCVYIIQAGWTGPVKIGYARDIASRFSAIQTGNHERLVIRLLMDGARLEEAELHARFAPLRLHGEWFVCVPEIERFIREQLAKRRAP